MRNILVDAGPIVALFDRGDRYHDEAVAFVGRTKAVMHTNLPILAETMANLDFSVDAQIAALSWVEDSMRIDSATWDDLPRITEIMEKYRDLPADFADASLVAFAERAGTLDIATIDRDFEVYRTKDKKRFVNAFLKN